jgi:hypothetical protein
MAKVASPLSTHESRKRTRWFWQRHDTKHRLLGQLTGALRWVKSPEPSMLVLSLPPLIAYDRSPTMRTRIVFVLVLAVALLPLSATAWNEHKPTKIVGQYFLSDDDLELAGGAVLYSDCTHDGSVIGAAIPAGRPGVPTIVGKLTATYWVNDPDPADYPQWAVPEPLLDMPRLLLCYDLRQLDGISPGPRGEFCDWAPRDLKRPLAVDFENDGVINLLIGVVYNGGRRLCSEP